MYLNLHTGGHRRKAARTSRAQGSRDDPRCACDVVKLRATVVGPVTCGAPKSRLVEVVGRGRGRSGVTRLRRVTRRFSPKPST